MVQYSAGAASVVSSVEFPKHPMYRYNRMWENCATLYSERG